MYCFKLFDKVDAIEDLSSNMQHGCHWMQIHTLYGLYFDDQCQVQVFFDFFLK
jgi:hypothetical protein